VKQFCGDVKFGGGRVQACLRQNEEKLSPACKAKRAATETKIRGIVQNFVLACRNDFQRLCSEVKPGKGRVLACLLRQQDDLSSSCREQTDRYQAAAEKVTAVRAACKADVERLCGGAPPDAGGLVECLQAHRDELSGTCRSVDPELGSRAAVLVDAVDTVTSGEKTQALLQILQGIESIVFSRSQILLQFDSFDRLGGTANANRLLLNPQIVFGDRSEFAVQVRAPVTTVYPDAPGRSARTGLGAVTTAFAWAFFGAPRVHQYASLALQWKSAALAPVGAGWAVTPSYAITVGLARWLSLTGQFAWTRSFASSGYPEVDLFVAEPIVVVNFPRRSFVALDTRLGVSFVGGTTFVPVIRGIVGAYMNRQRSLSVSAWYQASLSSAAEAQSFNYGVGMALAYFFDW
jgi:hypothetical protein